MSSRSGSSTPNNHRRTGDSTPIGLPTTPTNRVEWSEVMSLTLNSRPSKKQRSQRRLLALNHYLTELSQHNNNNNSNHSNNNSYDANSTTEGEVLLLNTAVSNHHSVPTNNQNNTDSDTEQKHTSRSQTAPTTSNDPKATGGIDLAVNVSAQANLRSHTASNLAKESLQSALLHNQAAADKSSSLQDTLCNGKESADATVETPDPILLATPRKIQWMSATSTPIVATTDIPGTATSGRPRWAELIPFDVHQRKWLLYDAPLVYRQCKFQANLLQKLRGQHKKFTASSRSKSSIQLVKAAVESADDLPKRSTMKLKQYSYEGLPITEIAALQLDLEIADLDEQLHCIHMYARITSSVIPPQLSRSNHSNNNNNTTTGSIEAAEHFLAVVPLHQVLQCVGVRRKFHCFQSHSSSSQFKLGPIDKNRQKFDLEWVYEYVPLHQQLLLIPRFVYRCPSWSSSSTSSQPEPTVYSKTIDWMQVNLELYLR
jgi:hypothetical protein